MPYAGTVAPEGKVTVRMMKIRSIAAGGGKPARTLQSLYDGASLT
jgi:N-methylhydantoinase A/oxoprolinase/acetone carboxylase beta subunit